MYEVDVRLTARLENVPRLSTIYAENILLTRLVDRKTVSAAFAVS